MQSLSSWIRPHVHNNWLWNSAKTLSFVLAIPFLLLTWLMLALIDKSNWIASLSDAKTPIDLLLPILLLLFASSTIVLFWAALTGIENFRKELIQDKQFEKRADERHEYSEIASKMHGEIEKIFEKPGDPMRSTVTGRYAVYLRPFGHDSSLRHHYCILPEPRAVASYLRRHPHAEAVLHQLKWGITGEDDSWRRRDPLLHNLPMDTQEAISVMFFNHDLNLHIPLTFEEFLSILMVGRGAVVGLGYDEFSSNYQGVFYRRTDDAGWKKKVIDLLSGADFIVIVPGSSPGTLWEIEQILQSVDLVSKTLLFIPSEEVTYESVLRQQLQASQSPQSGRSGRVREILRQAYGMIIPGEEGINENLPQSSVREVERQLLRRERQKSLRCLHQMNVQFIEEDVVLDKDGHSIPIGGAYQLKKEGVNIRAIGLFYFSWSDWLFDRTDDWLRERGQ